MSEESEPNYELQDIEVTNDMIENLILGHRYASGHSDPLVRSISGDIRDAIKRLSRLEKMVIELNGINIPRPNRE